MPSFDTLAPGPEPIAAYQPIFELGRGGMGTVHLARAVGAGGFERLVVVKRLKQELVDFQEAVQRFLDEARQAALIHHANVVGTHQIGRDQEGYFLVLDYVEGGSLDDLLGRAKQRRQVVPPSIVLRVALDALAGLSAAHAATDPKGRPLNMLHRDVSPQNVLVGRDGVSRLADFGVAKSALASVQTDQRYLVGKLLYLPPEYLARRPVGPTLDIYALGVTLWTALAGSDPWPNASEAALIVHICQEGVPSLSGVGVRLAPQVEALVMRACDQEPRERFQSAREMADEIEGMARETGWVASHAEVAELLDDLIGADLAARRERVAAVVATLPRPDSPSERTFHSVPPRVDAHGATKRVLRGEQSDGIEVPVARGGTPLLVAVGIGFIMIVGAVLYGFSGRTPNDGVNSGASSAASAQGAVPTNPPTKISPEPTGLIGVQSDQGEPDATGHEGDRPASTVKSGNSSGHTAARIERRSRSVSHAEPSSKPPAITPVAPPVVAPGPPGPAAPDSISKSNPYR